MDKPNGPLLYDRFSSYGVQPTRGDEPEMAIVPEKELQALIEFANLAQAAGPAQCNHPADSLEAFDLIADACVCGTCGAVLKNYSDREALALGLKPGWNRMTAELLAAEVHRAIKPAVDVLNYVRVETGDYGDARDVMGWADGALRSEIA